MMHLYKLELHLRVCFTYEIPNHDITNNVFTKWINVHCKFTTDTLVSCYKCMININMMTNYDIIALPVATLNKNSFANKVTCL